MNIQECEANITEGFSSAAEALYRVGKNLAQIKDQKWYRDAGFQTFDAYMKECWDMNRNQGYNLIYAAEILDELRGSFERYQLPQTESSIRPLRSVPQERRVEVWREVLKRGRSSLRPPGKGVVEAVISEMCA